MITGRDIIIVGLQPWDIPIGSNCKNIADELSRFNRVLYVNPPLDRGTYLRRRKDPFVQKRLKVIHGEENGLVQVKNNLWNLYPESLAESINWINNRLLFSALNKINNKRFAASIKQAIDKLGFKNYILFNDQSMIRCYSLKELLAPNLFVYYIRDNLSTIPYFQRHALKMEETLIAKADVVATNSEFLAAYARKFNSNAAMVGQGCDFTLYSNPEKIPVALELLPLPRPTIGYVGFLTSVRLDIPLLEYIARKRSDWNIVLVGPEDDDFRKSELHKMKNVFFMGNKSPDTLPSFIQGFDVALNPQVVNEVTMGNYPRKIDEYLAMGKPTVATKTPFMEYFRDYTYLASTKEEYIVMIEKALQENNKEFQAMRRNFALTHTWENNVEAISKLIESNTENKHFNLFK